MDDSGQTQDTAIAIEKEIRALGFPDYRLTISAENWKPNRLRLLHSTKAIELPAPQTVFQLRRFASSLQNTIFIGFPGVRLGPTYGLVGRDSPSPLGMVEQSTASGLLSDVKRLEAAIRDMPNKRPIEDPTWNDMDYSTIIRLGEDFRVTRGQWGGIQTRLKPGPEERSMDEVIQIINKWRKWKLGGHSQQDFADHYLYGSRKVLTNCIRRFRDAFGDSSI